MLFRPRKEMHFSRRAMGFAFLGCGILMTAIHYLAGAPLFLLAAVFLYFAPRWNLRIVVEGDRIWFSENVLDAGPVELRISDLAEIRRVSEQEDRKGLLTTHPEYIPFVEFETRDGKVWRMHDIFPEDLDEELVRVAVPAGVQVKDLEN